VEAGGNPALVAIPGATLFQAGLFISISITGNAADMSVHAHLSACVGEQCDGSVGLVGSALAGLGFPLPLLEFDDLAFTQCPAADADSNDMNMMMIAAAAAATVVVVAIVAYFTCRKTAKPPTTASSGFGTQMTAAHPPAQPMAV